MKLLRLISDYRWPIFIGGHLTMSVVACGVLVWVATRPDVPRPIPGYYEAAQTWDADEAADDASRALGWTVRYVLPADVPHVPGMPRPIDVTVVDRQGRPVTGLSGRVVVANPADSERSLGELVAVPMAAGSYRTLLRLDQPGAWDVRLDARREAMRFVHAARLRVEPDTAAASPEAR